jgi:serine/threonine-protein kinase
MSDILSLQAEVAQSITREIRLTLPRPELAHPEAPRNIPVRAYDAYVNARHELNEMTAASIASSVPLFRAATKRDSKFALAFAGLANAQALLAMAPFDAVAPRKAMPAAKWAARRAIALDPTLAEAHTALGLVLHHYEWAWEEAEREYLIATRLNPAYLPARLHRAWLLMALGRHNEAIEESDRAAAVARETDPRLSGLVTGTRAAAHYFLRQYDRAMADSLAAIQADPDSVFPYYVLGRAYARRGVQMEAVAHFEKLAPQKSGNLLLTIALAHAQAVSGRTEEARSTLRGLHALAKKRYVLATYFAMLHAALGERDRAFQWFEKAYRERADGLTLLNVDPMVDGLRENPRFRRLVRRIGLTR